MRAAGADELAVHARTKADGYRPPARWPLVAPVSDARTRINGEIWSPEDARAARTASGCRTVMLGRGALAAPDLASRISRDAAHEVPLAWERVVDLVRWKFVDSDSGSPRHVGNRTKQWLGYLSRTYPEARALFLALRPLHEIGPILRGFDAHSASPANADGRQPSAALPPAPVAMQPNAGSSAGR